MKRPDGTRGKPEALAEPVAHNLTHFHGRRLPATGTRRLTGKRSRPAISSARSSRLLARLCRLPKPLQVCEWRGAAWKFSRVFSVIFSSRTLTSRNRGAYRSTRRNDASSKAPSQRPRVVSDATTGFTRLMIRPIGPLRNAWVYTRSMRLPRSGPPAGALGNQLSALRRRHQLRQQQEDIQAGLVDYQAMPPYPPRPRPPS